MLTRIDNEVKSARDRNILKFLYSECKATDETINAMINVINNGRDAYDEYADYRFNDFRTAWPVGTWSDDRADPIRADQVEGTKKTVDKYLKAIEDPRNQVYYNHRVKNTRLASTLRFLYFTCHVSKEIVDNMIHVINNPDLYKDELQQTLNEMGSTWLGFHKNNDDVKQALKRRLKDNAATYFTNPNLYLKHPEKPPEAPPVVPPMAPPVVPQSKPKAEPQSKPLADIPGSVPQQKPKVASLEDSSDDEDYSEVKYPIYRKFLKRLSRECGVPNAWINNMIQVINNSDLYVDEMNVIDEMRQSCAQVNLEDPRSVASLKNLLTLKAAMHFRDPNKYLKPQPKPKAETQSGNPGGTSNGTLTETPSGTQ